VVNASSSSRRIRAGILMLAALAVVAAGAAPLCTSLCCPPAPPEAAFHAAMPCCTGEDSMTPSDALDVQHAPPATARVHAPQQLTVAATLAPPSAPSLGRESTRVLTRHDPSPPLFLLNAQFLI
jgi:hypothetical protein